MPMHLGWNQPPQSPSHWNMRMPYLQGVQHMQQRFLFFLWFAKRNIKGLEKQKGEKFGSCPSKILRIQQVVLF
ncbi:hypothetical protein FGO68_gene15176 [Halteria grandinella]|uniref:Uncharacterized protein n=1 Tax=Halteria grandinella TaxID=5974 RepID=A0A8J8NF84_HALGN|nr:hypothetical protein FGO68_gene15176 [Halteria grandinella]